MKDTHAVIFNWLLPFILFCVSASLLCSCTTIYQLINPTPVPAPVGENDDWSIKVLSIKKYDEPRDFNCTECDPNESQKGLSLQEKNSFVDVRVQIINKSPEVKEVDEITIGLMLNIFTYGCGGVTVVGTDFCLPSGMIRGGQNYVNYGIDSDGFGNHLVFSPNAPDGEIVDFIFIVKPRARYTGFHFDRLIPLNIKKLKPQPLPVE